MIKAFMPPFQRVLFGVFGILALILLGTLSAQFLREQRAEAQSGGILLRSEDFLYVGSFRLPQGDYGGSDFNFSDGKIAYNSLRHSLYISGNVTRGNDVAEVSIPEIRKGAALSDLSTATVLQPFADISDGRIGELGALDSNGARLGGLIVDGMRKLVYWTAYLWYSYLGGPGSHGTSPLDLSKPDDATGLLRVGDVHPRAIAGYMAAIPSSWIARLGARFLSGQSNLNIVSTSSIGPAAIGFNPEDLGVKNPVPGISYVYYIVGSSATLGDYDSAVVPGDPLRSINGTAKFGGVVFPEGTDSVLFFGTQGIGAFCYGSQAQCNDPVGEWQGPHARNGDYRIAIWAYNAADFEKVRQGTLQPAQVVPYAVWNSTFPFSYPDASTYMVKGVAYDGDRRLYITTTGDSQATPVISVYDIVVGGQSATGNQAPSVNAGPDQSVALPSNATLNGAATDDGLPNPPGFFTVAWTMVSGPGTVTFGNAGALQTIASFSVAGTYVLRLTANDGARSSSDAVTVTVTGTASGGGGEGGGRVAKRGVLLAYWKFDEALGTTAADATGNGYDGTLMNGPMWTAGKAGGALSFDGTNDYVDVGNVSALNLANGDYTLSAWVNVSQQSGYYTWIAGKYDDQNFGYSLRLNGSSNSATNAYLNHNGNNASGTSNVQNNAWHHIAGVRSGNTSYLYVDGALEGQQATNSLSMAGSHSFTVGRSGAGDNFMNGLLDDVCIWDKALSAEEIGKLWNGGNGLPCDHLNLPPPTEELCLSPRPENRIRLASQDFSNLPTTLTITDPQGLIVYSGVHTPETPAGEIRITDSTVLSKIVNTTPYTLTAHPESHRRRKMTLLGSALKASPCDPFPSSPFGFLDDGLITINHLVRLIAHYRMQNDAAVNRAFLSQRFTLRDLISVIRLYVSKVGQE